MKRPTSNPRNPWNLPSVQSFGEQVRRLQANGYQRSEPKRPSLRVVFASGAVAALLVATVLILAPGRPAQANSIVNEAPAAAQRAGSLRFRSTLTMRAHGHPRPGISEEGAIDFLTAEYTTTTRFATSDQRLERRRIDGVLYASRGPVGSAPGKQTLWGSAPVRKGTPGGFASESDAFTDPPSVFRSLAHITAPVRRIGPANLKGVPTTLYELSTSLATFLASDGGHVQDPAMYREVHATLKVWIDREGRPRQVDETFAAGGSYLSTLVQFGGYGQAVLVQAPPSSLVRPTRGAIRPNPLGAGPGPLLAPLLFFNAGTAHAPARQIPTPAP
jgi:hypothetical protein